MSSKRKCAGVLKNPKHPEVGRPCNRWAVNGSDMCQVHGGSEAAGFANPESLEHRCIARSNRTGSQCKKPAQRGMRVCRTHGGANPAAQNKAQELLDRMVEPVLWELRDLALNTKTSDSDKLRAIQMVLDRTMPKERKIEVELKPWEITMQQIFTPRTDGSFPVEIIKGDTPETLDAYPQPRFEEVEDAELVVEEDYDPRAALPQIRPGLGPDNRAGIVMGSGDPIQRPGYR